MRGRELPALGALPSAVGSIDEIVFPVRPGLRALELASSLFPLLPLLRLPDRGLVMNVVHDAEEHGEQAFHELILARNFLFLVQRDLVQLHPQCG